MHPGGAELSQTCEYLIATTRSSLRAGSHHSHGCIHKSASIDMSVKFSVQAPGMANVMCSAEGLGT